MASRRMFSLDVVDTDKFLDMPLTAQCLYFHLGMRADDDGFIDAPRRILRYVGSNDDDLKLLLAKGYLIPFEDGVIVIKDWPKNNWIRPDRKKTTRYTEKLSMLAVENDAYIIALPKESAGCQPDVNQMSTKCQPSDIPSIGKDSIGKYNITISKDIVSKKQGNIHTQNQPREEIPYQQIVDMFNSICISFPRVTKLSEARKKAISARYRQYGMENFEKLFEMAEGSSFLKGSNDRNWSASFDWLIADKNMAKVLDGNYMDRQGERNTGQAQSRKAYKQFNEREYDRKQMDDLERMLLKK